MIKNTVFLMAALSIAANLDAASLNTTVLVTGNGWGWALAAPIAGLLIGGLLIFMSVKDGRTAKASVQWPSVPGVVVFSGIVQDTSGDIATSNPVVTYNYVVNGQTLQSSRVRFNPLRSNKILKLYPKGNPVQVFFDPQRPSTAVLEKGGSTRVGLFAGVAVILGSFGIGLLLGMSN